MPQLSPPVRIFALVAVLVAVGGGLFMFMTGGAPAQESALPVLSHADAVKAAAAKKAAAGKATPAAKKATPATKVTKAKAAAKAPATKPKTTAAKAAASAPKPAQNAPQPVSGLPVQIDQALATHALVVVSLVVPGARVDELAAAEAQAGAKLAGVGYLALNVLNEDVARALLTKLGAVGDPSLLVVKRGGEVALTLNGFIDRDTVAQAAANAVA
jgi:thiol:disulfide interchange protein